MFSHHSPASSPLAHVSSKSVFQPQLYQPTQSSPLSESVSSPTNNVQTRRRQQYKSQTSSRSSLPTPPLNLLGALEDTPQKRFLRGRFKAQCLERVKQGRARAVRKGRESGAENGSSSDGFDGDGDFAMEDDDGDIYDDEIYRRVVMNDQRRSQHAKRVSFEKDFGSSIDPNMYDDMNKLEWELTGQTPNIRAPSPPSDDLDDDLIQEYLAELEEMERLEAEQKAMHVNTGVVNVNEEDPGALECEFTAGNVPEHPSPSRSMYSDFQMSSPPSSLSRWEFGSDAPTTPPRPISTRKCPFCSTLTQRSHVACTSCAAQYALDHARTVWFDEDSHPGVSGRTHIPLATKTPSESGVGIVMLCGAPGCDWCFAL